MSLSSPKPFHIAIDGLSASGKGTLARRLAERLGFAYLDTGILYRAVALSVLRAGKSPSDAAAAIAAAQALDPSTLVNLADDGELRQHHVSEATSVISVIPAVRAALLDFQRNFAAAPPDGKAGAVLDGRDIGTAILPAAEVKLYVTASPEVRANRRYKELRARGEDVSEAQVFADLKIRDERDTTRAIVPALPASDAIILDTTDLSPDEALNEALEITKNRGSS